MSTAPDAPRTDPVVAARRELHELAVLASASLRLAIKVQARLDALRHTLGDVGPLDPAEVDRHAPSGAGSGDAPALTPAGAAAGGEPGPDPLDEEDPAALLAMSLAGEGLSREQVAAYLEQSFGMAETDALLDRVMPSEPTPG